MHTPDVSSSVLAASVGADLSLVCRYLCSQHKVVFLITSLGAEPKRTTCVELGESQLLAQTVSRTAAPQIRRTDTKPSVQPLMSQSTSGLTQSVAFMCTAQCVEYTEFSFVAGFQFLCRKEAAITVMSSCEKINSEHQRQPRQSIGATQMLVGKCKARGKGGAKPGSMGLASVTQMLQKGK